MMEYFYQFDKWVCLEVVRYCHWLQRNVGIVSQHVLWVLWVVWVGCLIIERNAYYSYFPVVLFVYNIRSRSKYQKSQNIQQGLLWNTFIAELRTYLLFMWGSLFITGIFLGHPRSSLDLGFPILMNYVLFVVDLPPSESKLSAWLKSAKESPLKTLQPNLTSVPVKG